MDNSKSPDFIPFSDTPLTPRKFTPNNYSSPQTYTTHNFGNSPQNFQNSPQYSPQQNSPQHFQNSPRTYNKINPNHSPINYYKNHNHRYSMYNGSRSFGNNSSNGSYNKTFSMNNSSQNSDGFNKFAYLHPSFMEDPWARLESQVKENN